jgi:hypothetical protein
MNQPKVWAVCDEYAAGPYKDRAAAERDLARYDCPLPHEVVESETKPVPLYAALNDELDDELVETESGAAEAVQ